MVVNPIPDKTYKGWQASLALQFCHSVEKTRLHSARHSGPLTVQRPFYPEGNTCHLYLLHPPGGIVGGDELDISVTLDAQSHVLLTMPGASKFYRSGGPTARLRQHFHLAPKATLEWLPQDAIFFPGAQARVDSVFHISTGSRLLAWDLLCLGRPVINETFHRGCLNNRIDVWKDGVPLLIERLYLADGDLSAVAEHPWVGTLLFYPADDAQLEGVRERLEPLGAYAGATLIDQLLTVRFLSHDNLICLRAMREIWRYMRPRMLQKSPVFPRIWHT